MFPAFLLSAVVSVIGCGALFASDFPVISAAGHSSPETYPGLTLAWREEFNGRALNPRDWDDGAGDADRAGEPAGYESVRVQNGYLVLSAREPVSDGQSQYASPRVATHGKRSFRQGRIDVRALLPGGPGLRSELKLVHGHGDRRATGGLNVLSLFVGQGREDTVHGELLWAHSRGTRYEGGSFTLPSGTFADQFHVFSVEWGASAIRWLVDGHAYLEQDISDPAFDAFRGDFHLQAELAVTVDTAGRAAFPRHLVLDYIRVFQ